LERFKIDKICEGKKAFVIVPTFLISCFKTKSQNRMIIRNWSHDPHVFNSKLFLMIWRPQFREEGQARQLTDVSKEKGRRGAKKEAHL
jgi:hypothetical protein